MTNHPGSPADQQQNRPDSRRPPVPGRATAALLALTAVPLLAAFLPTSGTTAAPGRPGAPAVSASPSPSPSSSASAPPKARIAQLEDAVAVLPTGDEDRTGYRADAFGDRGGGLDAGDGCATREEVLIAEAVEAPAVGARCALTGGRWVSYYDGQAVTSAAALVVDHVVPLAEAWGSGASAWTPARRAAYANDRGAEATLTAVTSRTARAKADRDIASWLPPAESALCRYAGDWVGTKLRWGLTADKDEVEALKLLADGPCETTVVVHTPVP
jgi:hypothetical protein